MAVCRTVGEMAGEGDTLNVGKIKRPSEKQFSHLLKLCFQTASLCLWRIFAVWYSELNLNQDKATKPQTVQIVRQGEATPYWFKFNPLYLKNRLKFSVSAHDSAAFRIWRAAVQPFKATNFPPNTAAFTPSENISVSSTILPLPRCSNISFILCQSSSAAARVMTVRSPFAGCR